MTSVPTPAPAPIPSSVPSTPCTWGDCQRPPPPPMRPNPTKEEKNKERKAMCDQMMRDAKNLAKEIQESYERGDLLNTAMCGIMGWANPQCYKAEAKNLAAQFNAQYSFLDASSNNQITTTSNCDASLTSTQINEIDTSQCPYCQEHSCDVSGNVQTNVTQLIGDCQASNALSLLFSKKLDLESITKAKALQEAKASGPLTDAVNTAINAVCNQSEIDMSSNDIFELMSKCSTHLTSVQKNKLSSCGSVLNNVQKNESINYLKCLADNTTDMTVKDEIKMKLESIAETEQTATAEFLPLSASLGSISFIIVLVFVAIFFVS